MCAKSKISFCRQYQLNKSYSTIDKNLPKQQFVMSPAAAIAPALAPAILST